MNDEILKEGLNHAAAVLKTVAEHVSELPSSVKATLEKQLEAFENVEEKGDFL